jgi:phosphoribosylglycinamide formyltransferase-1
MYGMHIHEAVKKALDAGEITESGFTMHFVTEEHDRGPAFFEYRVPLEKGMSVEDIAKAVQKAEHEWQPKITNMVVHGEIRWDGKDPKSLVGDQRGV